MNIGKQKYLILAMLYIGSCISFIDRSVMNYAISFIGEEFHLSSAVLGVTLSSFFIGYSLMQFPGGWLADKFGSRKIIIFTITFWSIFTAATGFAWSLASLVVIRVLFGFFEGGFPPASLKEVSVVFPREERPKMSSVLWSSSYFGYALAPIIVAPLLASFGWRKTFYIVGLIGLVFVLFYWILTRHQFRREETKEEVVKAEKKMSLKQLLKIPILWKFVVILFTLSLVNKGLDAWMPTYLLKVRHLDIKSIGFLAPIPSIAAGIGSILFGWMMDKYFKGREKYLVFFAAVISTIFVYCMYTASSIALLITFQTLCYFFKSFIFAAAFAIPQRIFPSEVMGSASGLINSGGQLAGFLSPVLIGFLITLFNGSYDAVFWYLIGALGVSAIIGLSLTRHIKSVEPSVIEKA